MVVSEPTFPQVGGHAAFDLVDTVHWRLNPARAIDTLPTWASVLRWCEQLGVFDPGEGRLAELADESPHVAVAEREAVVALREAVYGAVFEGSPEAVTLIEREYVDALGRSALVRDEKASTWTWRAPSDATGPRAAIAFLAHDLLTSDLNAARQCGDDACGWVYLDSSPRRNRVWCTSAGCGNRNRVARHHARSKK